jgi:cell division protein FtsL
MNSSLLHTENNFFHAEDSRLHPEDNVLLVGDSTVGEMLYLCTRKPMLSVMDVNVIITSALATVILLLVIGMALAIAYYRWRTTELLSGFREFILRNRRLEDEVERLTRELEQLKKNESCKTRQ